VRRNLPDGFVWSRLEELREQLYVFNFDLDDRPGVSKVDPLYSVDPALGLVEVMARLADDPRIMVVLTEKWTPGFTGIHPQRGLTVASATYKAVWLNLAGDVKVHYDYDPMGHPATPIHWHPPFADTATGRRKRRLRPCLTVRPQDALQAALQLSVDTEQAALKGLIEPADLVDELDPLDYLP
jgi:hypothetical protein